MFVILIGERYSLDNSNNSSLNNPMNQNLIIPCIIQNNQGHINNMILIICETLININLSPTSISEKFIDLINYVCWFFQHQQYFILLSSVSTFMALPFLLDKFEYYYDEDPIFMNIFL